MINRRIIFRSILVITLFFVITFLLAGRLDYWQGWVYNGLNLIFIILSLFLLPDELISERLKPKKGMKRWDKIYFIISTPIFYIMFILSVLDGSRFNWKPVISLEINIIAVFLYILGQSIFLWAKSVNKYFSTVVRIQKERGHTVCTAGPYRLIRHPGYLGGIIYIIATPSVLDSFWGIIPAMICVILIIIRTYFEDKTLQEELEGYTEYIRKVKYRLLPKIW